MKRNERLIYVPLGGAGEIGMNMYLYGVGEPDAENFIMVDAGVTFPDMETSPGVNLITPDDEFVKNNLERLCGIFISHAHEDHVGAVANLYGHTDVPIFSRKFTGEIIRNKLGNLGIDDSKLNIVDSFPQKVSINCFEVSFIPIPHSVPESSCILIETAQGNIFHSGDFKIDHNPVIGDSIDYQLIKKATSNNILALMCDSTNVFSKHSGRSESLLNENFDDLFLNSRGLVVATTFASNLARLKTIAVAAKNNGREICVLGRAMNSMLKAAQSVGILKDFPGLISPKEAKKIPRERLLILATGSQGEDRAASAQLSYSGYMNFTLGEGDTFVFSSKTIPGNEVSVTAIVNRFVERGVEVIYEDNDKFHVSGHPNEPDLKKMHEIICPKSVIPIHGEFRHLKAHCDLAREGGYDSMVVPNGKIIEITENGVKSVGQVPSGRLYLDGSQLVDSNSKVISDRLKLAKNGICIVSIIIDESDSIYGSVWVETIGIPWSEEVSDLDGVIEEGLNHGLESLRELNLSDDNEIETFIKSYLNKAYIKKVGKKPFIKVLISRMA